MEQLSASEIYIFLMASALHAIAEVGRGHRKTDLMDETLYPTDYDLGDGNSQDHPFYGWS